MSATKFTPGPWVTHKGHSVVGISAADRDIADTSSKAYYQAFDEEDLANAHLIAAAPDLYAALYACETVMMMVEPRSDKAEYLGALNAAKAALAKARGEPVQAVGVLPG